MIGFDDCTVGARIGNEQASTGLDGGLQANEAATSGPLNDDR